MLSMATLAILMVGVMRACAEKSPYPGYQKTATGLFYQFFRQNKEAAQPQLGNLVDVAFCCTVNDSIFYPNTEITLAMEAPMFAGDFFEGLALMHIGDSASFIVNIDSTFIKWFRQPSLPEEFKSTDVMRFEVRLDDSYPESEYPKHMAAKLKKMTDERIAKMKEEHPEETAKAAIDLADYLAKNKIEVEPTESGLYYVMITEGNGEKPEPGQVVKIHYTGKLLDGTVFDSSVERGDPISLPIGVGQFIPAWDEGIMMMSKGEKGMLYVPYYLAYGDRQAGDKILPFSNLIFEVELIDFE